MSTNRKIDIIGAGPAGLMAAITAAEAGGYVTLWERMPNPGVKLSATGGGRCNLTNTLSTGEYIASFGKQGAFMRPALHAFDAPALCRFFASLGVETHCPDGFHIFPVVESAPALRDALVKRCRESGIALRTDTTVERLIVHDGRIHGFISSQGDIKCDTLLLAAGGCAWPALGSDGSGFTLAHQVGHTLVSPAPALTPLVTRQRWPHDCAGIVINGARVRIDLPKASKAGVTGDLLFTHRGISGPAVLDISREVARRLEDNNEPVPLRLYLTKQENPEAWMDHFAEWRAQHPKRLVRTLVAEQLPHSLAQAACTESGISDTLRAAEFPRAAGRKLAEFLAGVRVDIVRTEGFERAMATAGGVSTGEVDPRTLQSKKVRGLYFAGEILDIDGRCGGYNLQWAFSSGFLAGRSMAAYEASQ